MYVCSRYFQLYAAVAAWVQESRELAISTAYSGPVAAALNAGENTAGDGLTVTILQEDPPAVKSPLRIHINLSFHLFLSRFNSACTEPTSRCGAEIPQSANSHRAATRSEKELHRGTAVIELVQKV